MTELVVTSMHMYVKAFLCTFEIAVISMDKISLNIIKHYFKIYNREKLHPN